MNHRLFCQPVAGLLQELRRVARVKAHEAKGIPHSAFREARTCDVLSTGTLFAERASRDTDNECSSRKSLTSILESNTLKLFSADATIQFPPSSSPPPSSSASSPSPATPHVQTTMVHERARALASRQSKYTYLLPCLPRGRPQRRSFPPPVAGRPRCHGPSLQRSEGRLSERGQSVSRSP